MSLTRFSDFGTKLCGHSGILQLMDDLGKPLPKDMPSYQLGGGNPAQIPAIAAMYRAQMEKILANGTEFDDVIGRYDAPQGRTAFIEAVASYLSHEYGWNIGPENVAITNGSQSACFYLFNLFSGTYTNGKKATKKKLLFPLVPEYIGYADQGIESGTFVKEKTSYSVEQDTYLILDSKGSKVETEDRPVFTTKYSKGSSYTHINGLYCENHVSQGKSSIKGAVASAMLWKNPFLYVTFILTVGFVAVFIYSLKKSKSTKQS